ncbi:MAG TPA: hypothetical protein VHA52_10920 [Candidatus Babeliaceae bacterium]|nr:hypothetical protein [Candidatus Babeliaceae bacterium]
MVAKISVMNGTHSHTTSPAIAKKNAEGKKKELNIGLVKAGIGCLPEMERILEEMLKFYAEQHVGKSATRLSQKFERILSNNIEFFKGLDTQQKAQALFDKYIENTYSKFCTTLEYKQNYKEIYQLIAEWVGDPETTHKIMREEIETICKSRIATPFIASAIGAALKLEPEKIIFSDNFQPRDLDLTGVDFSIEN